MHIDEYDEMSEDTRDRTALAVALDELGEQLDACRMVTDRLSVRLDPILLPEEDQPEEGDALAIARSRQSPLADQIERRAFDARGISETLRHLLARVDL